MGAILTGAFRVLITILGGVGAGHLLDKVAADKVPNYPAGGTVAPFKDENGLNIPKILWFALAAVVGTLIVKFIGKKFNIKILK